MSFKKKALAIFASILAIVAVVIGGVTLALADAGDVPAHGKTLKANGDGTYTLELSVTGDADYDAEPVKANVIIVLDTSGSMDFLIPSTTGSRGSTATDGDTRNNNFQLYKRSGTGYGATYTAITDAEAYTGTVYRRNQYGGGYSEYTGTRYSTTSRMTATKTSVNNLIDTLASQNTTANPDTIEMSLITFASDGVYNTPGSATANNWVSGNGQSLKTTVSNLNANGGTNWDDALYRANNLAAAKAQQQPTEKVYVVFFSDGEPTFSNTTNNNDSPTSHTHGTSSNDGGGQSGGTTTQNREANSAYYHANQIHNATYDSALYGIFAFGTEESYMKNTISYGNYGDASHASSVEGDLYFNANSEDDIEAAFSKIAQSIINAVGITDVSITDGTTNQVQTSTGVAELLEVDDQSFEYWLSWNLSQGTNTFKSFIDGKEVDCTAQVSGNNVVITWNGGTATYEGTITGSVVKVKWTQATPFYDYAPPAAEFNSATGAVDWDLEPVGTLLDGVTYSVSFDVYPSQETLDDVADIKNNPGPNGAWKDLDPAVQQYIDQNGNLKTNTTATLTYSDTRLDEPGPKTSTFTNPDPVENAAVEQMAVTKVWDNALQSEWTMPDSIDLNVTRDGDPHYNVSLTKDNDWKGSVFVSIGIMGNDGKPLAGSEGHDFTFTEPQIAEGFRWEIDAPTVHPMLINNVPTMLIKVDEAHPAPSGATTYTFNNATYYVDSAAGSLTATNERRSSINLVKAVDGEDAPEDAIFPFTLNVVNSLAPATAPSEQQDPGHDSDYWVWISVWDKNSTPVTSGAVVSGATSAGGGWYYGVSGQDIVLNVKDGYSIRINNVPTGTKYTITEGNTTTPGFTFDSAEIEFTEGRQPDPEWTFSGDKTSTGSVDSTNAVYTITYNNTYELNDVIVKKVWDDANNQDGKRPTSLELTLNADGEVVTGATPTITGTNTDTWTYTWEDLPRYDAETGEEIVYTVTEAEVPDGYTCATTTAEDGGTITNTHTPETTEIDVEKVWVGPEGDAVTVTLYANGEATDKTLTLNANNEWKGSFENLPVYASGEKIEYSVVEAGVTGVDATKYDTEITGDAEGGFTITNTNTETVDITVTKAWDDANDQDAKRPDELELTLNGAPEGTTVPDPTVSKDGNNWTYTWTGLPKYDADGEEIEYTVTEETAPEGYTASGSPASDKGTITNKYTPETVSINVEKIWKGPEGDAVTVKLYADDAATDNTLTLNAENEWKGTFENLPKFKNVDGTATEIEYSVVEAGVTGVDATKYDTEITGDAEGGFTITNTNTETVDITVTKAWDDANDQDGIRPDELELTLNGAPDGITVPDPTVSKSGNNWTYTWTGLPKYNEDGSEVEYTVTEETAPEGYTASGSPADPDGTITNTHTPDVVDIKVTKIWVGPESVATINLKANGTVVATVKLGGENGNEKVWTGLPKNDNGKAIEYTVEEETLANYTQGEVQGDAESGFSITNTYQASGETQIKAKKVLDGGTLEKDQFEFTLEAVTEGAPMPEETTVTNDANGDILFGPITFTAEDLYGATDDSGDDSATPTPDESNASAPSQNGRAIVEDEAVEPVADESVAEPVADEPVVEPVTDEVVADEPEAIVKDEAEGAGFFDVIAESIVNFFAPTTAKAAESDNTFIFEYTITEKAGSESYITYDTNPIKVTITVVDNGDGTLTATPSYEPEDATITNEYTAEGTYVFEGTKVLEGTDVVLEDGQFTFTLTDSDGNEVTATNDADGKFSFDELTFTQDDIGKKVYTISEVAGDQARMVYDDTVYTITLTINDNGNGTLDIQADVTNDEITFTNTLEDPTPVISDPPIKKVVKGDKPEKDATFTFQMKAVSEDAPMPEGTKDGVMTVTITGTGENEFGEMTYTEPGEYVYEISEVDDGQDGYTYDKNSYTLTVTVEADEDGNLTKTEVVTDSEGNEVDFDGGMVFENTYKGPETPSNPPKKQETPRTGDTTPIIAIEAMAGFAVAMLAGGFALRRRDEK